MDSLWVSKSLGEIKDEPLAGFGCFWSLSNSN